MAMRCVSLHSVPNAQSRHFLFVLKARNTCNNKVGLFGEMDKPQIYTDKLELVYDTNHISIFSQRIESFHLVNCKFVL